MIGIRTQLALLVGIFVSLSLFGLAFFAAQEDRREKIRDAVSAADQILDALALVIRMQTATDDLASLERQFKQMNEDPRGPDFVELVVVDSNGAVVASDLKAPNSDFSDPEFLSRASSAERNLMERHEDRIYLSRPTVHLGSRATVVGCVSLARTEEAVVHSRSRLLGGAVALAAILVLGLFVGLSRMIVQPVRNLQKKAAVLGEGKLHERIEPHGGRELRELAETLNMMAGAIQHSTEELERRVEERTRELREANAQLERISVTDGLTGLFNHKRFQEELASEVLRAQRNGRPLSVLMIDVDHFKRFNDRFGHPAGDKLLRELAATLQKELRATDILARYGGEEFAVILPETPAEMAAQAAERLRNAVDQKLNAGDPEHHVSISVGVATRRDKEDAPQLIVDADKALYRAKNSGRNRVVIAA
ncbi:MAG: diguanylate cyclase [Myxococcaceae bacterium]